MRSFFSSFSACANSVTPFSKAGSKPDHIFEFGPAAVSSGSATLAARAPWPSGRATSICKTLLFGSQSAIGRDFQNWGG